MPTPNLFWATVDPLYYNYEMYMAGILLVVPITVWFVIRLNRWFRGMAFALVALTTVFSLFCLKDAIHDTRAWYPKWPDYYYIGLSVLATTLPLLACRMALVRLKSRSDPAPKSGSVGDSI